MFSQIKRILKKLKISLSALLVVLVGSFSWSLTMVKSGIVYNFGMGFWGPNGHDGVWHIALAESLSRGTWEMPIFAGEIIKNYHIGFDLLLSIFHKVTGIPLVNLYFQILPTIFALGVGYSLYRFVKLWKGEREAFWSLFFVYFGGSLGWIVTLIRTGKFGGESMFWSQQAISTLINPPYALSLLIIFSGLFHLVAGIRENRKRYLVVASILFGFLGQVKIYSAVLVLGSLFIVGMWRLIKRKGTAMIKVFTASLMISLLLILPVLDFGKSSIQFKPFWFLETMMGFADRFYWPKFAQALMNYYLGGNWIKYGIAVLVSFFVFWYGNLGTRLLWEVDLANKIVMRRKSDHVEIYFIIIIVTGAVIPMLVVQTGTPWNTIQFFYYSLTFSGILTGIGLSKFLENMKNKLKRYFIIFIIVILTIPTTVSTLWFHYLPKRPPAMIDNDELEALEFLRKQPYGVVLTMPFDRDAADAALDNPPRPLYLYESTAYVSAFSGKPVHLEDEVNLEITGYEWEIRKQNIEELLKSRDREYAKNFLSNNNIKYLYWVKPQKTVLNEEQLECTKIFENEETVIFSL